MLQKENQILPERPDFFLCLNCDQIIPPTRRYKLYCSDLCQSEAKFVRYVRSCIWDGRIEQPDVLDAIQVRLAHILSGGYAEEERYLPPSVREVVIIRDGGRCQKCGKKGTEIDHIKGSSNKLENLRLLCHTCHMEKTKMSLIKISPEDERYKKLKEKKDALLIRIEAPEPLRLCDDEKQWKNLWRKLVSERWQPLYDPNREKIELRIVDLRKQGISHRQIASQLNSQNIPTFGKRGKWERRMVGRILQKKGIKSSY